MKFYNKGIAAHLEAILKLLDDDHLVFENLQGQGPIDIITVNKHTGEVTFYDAKSDRTSRHKKRPQTQIQKKLGVKNIPADAIDKIQVIRNYNDVSALKGLENNEENVAMNIKLKKLAPASYCDAVKRTKRHKASGCMCDKRPGLLFKNG